MSLLSSSVSITRYRVGGKLEEPIIENVAQSLKDNAIPSIQDESSDKIIGWTSFDNPYSPNFESSSFVIGPFFVFSLRIDKKVVPAKIIKQHFSIEIAKKLAETNKEYLSKQEKQQIKENIINVLNMRIPFTPNVFDIVWDYEESYLLFFSTQRAANDEMETLFTKSFKIAPIRLFPYTIFEYMLDLSDIEKDAVLQLSPSKFTV